MKRLLVCVVLLAGCGQQVNLPPAVQSQLQADGDHYRSHKIIVDEDGDQFLEVTVQEYGGRVVKKVWLLPGKGHQTIDYRGAW